MIRGHRDSIDRQSYDRRNFLDPVSEDGPWETLTRIRHDSTVEVPLGGVGVGFPKPARLQRKHSISEAASCLVSHRGRTWTQEDHDGSSTPQLLMRERNRAPGLGFHLEETLQDIGSDITQTVSLGQPSLARNRAMTEDLRKELRAIAHRPSQDQEVKVDALRELGFTTEDLSRVVYDKFKDVEMPAFLDCISLEADGGIGRVKNILTPEKYCWFFMLVLSVAFNIGYLVSMDWTIFDTYITDVIGKWDVNNIPGRIESGGGVKSREKIQEALFDDPSFKASIFGMISDNRTRLLIVHASILVAIWEVTWIFSKVVYAGIILKVICFDPSEYRRFHYLSFLFQKLLPHAATFSAVKLMAKVHPSLIYSEYKAWLVEPPFYSLCPWLNLRATKSGTVVLAVLFVLVHVFCLVAALSAFAVKMLAVSFKMVNSSYSLLYRMGSILALLNQVMGCVIIETLLQDRLFLFVFGGQDSCYEDDELAYKNVYETRLVKKILDEFWNTRQYFSAIVLLATFDHYDLQRLLISENAEMQTAHRLGLRQEAELVRTKSEPVLNRVMPDVSALQDFQAPLMGKSWSGRSHRSQREAMKAAEPVSRKPSTGSEYQYGLEDDEDLQKLVPKEVHFPPEALNSDYAKQAKSDDEDNRHSDGEPQEEPDAELGQPETRVCNDSQSESSTLGSVTPSPKQAFGDGWSDEGSYGKRSMPARSTSFQRVTNDPALWGWADGCSDVSRSDTLRSNTDQFSDASP